MERHLLLFISTDDVIFVIPEMYDEQIAAASWIEDRRPWADGGDPVGLIEDVAEELSLHDGEVLLDDRMWELFSRDLRNALSDAEFGLASEVLADLRIRKEGYELERLREAARISDEACIRIRELGDEAIGMTELELAREIESRLIAQGGEGIAFEVVGSGPNGAQPHHRHGDREIERGDPVVLDFGALVDGYPGDQTRTIVFDGEPPDKFETVHGIVREAQQAAVKAIEPGIEAEDVDRAACEVTEDAGYGDAFIHRTGHGIGLEVHEPPYIVAGNDHILEPGMVFSVEPGVYLDGEFGVRIEDLVAVTDEGCERLNDSPRTWQVPN